MADCECLAELAEAWRSLQKWIRVIRAQRAVVNRV